MLRALLLLLLAGAQTGIPQRDVTSPEASAPATISGRITERESGQPIARALVTLIPADRSRYLEAVADDDGRYRFTGVAPGKYALVGRPPELRATHLRAVFGESGPDPYAYPRATLELDPGEQRAGLDLALSRALAIEGRIVDGWGEPMAGVSLDLRRPNGMSMSAQAESDDRGEYRLFGLAPGRYRVCAVPSSRFSSVPPEDGSRFVRTCHPGALHEAGASDVALTMQDATGIDIRMQRSRMYSVSGIVRSASGQPPEGAIVVAHALERHAPGARTRSEGGSFELRGLTPGRYVVTASLCQPRDAERPLPGCEPEFGFGHVDVIGEVSGLVIPMARPRAFAGRVVFDGVPAPPSSRVRLVVQTRPPPDLRRAVLSPLPAVVHDDLTFTLTNLYQVPLAVDVQDLPDGWALKAVRYDGRDITDLPVDLSSAPNDRPIEVVLTNRVARPVVRVTDADGGSVRAYRVAVLPPDPAKWNTASWLPPEEPAGDGAMRIGPLAPGEYLVAALRPADVMLVSAEPERITRVGQAAVRVTLAEGDTRTLDLRIATLPAEIR